MKINKFEIKNSGTAWNVINSNKRKEVKDEKTGSIKIIDKDIESYSFLRWALQYITRTGSDKDKTRATEVLSVLDMEFRTNRETSNNSYMQEYRNIEKKFFEDFGVKFDIQNGEKQIKLF